MSSIDNTFSIARQNNALLVSLSVKPYDTNEFTNIRLYAINETGDLDQTFVLYSADPSVKHLLMEDNDAYVVSGLSQGKYFISVVAEATDGMLYKFMHTNGEQYAKMTISAPPPRCSIDAIIHQTNAVNSDDQPNLIVTLGLGSYSFNGTTITANGYTASSILLRFLQLDSKLATITSVSNMLFDISNDASVDVLDATKKIVLTISGEDTTLDTVNSSYKVLAYVNTPSSESAASDSYILDPADKPNTPVISNIPLVRNQYNIDNLFVTEDLSTFYNNRNVNIKIETESSYIGNTVTDIYVDDELYWHDAEHSPLNITYTTVGAPTGKAIATVNLPKPENVSFGSNHKIKVGTKVSGITSYLSSEITVVWVILPHLQIKNSFVSLSDRILSGPDVGKRNLNFELVNLGSLPPTYSPDDLVTQCAYSYVDMSGVTRKSFLNVVLGPNSIAVDSPPASEIAYTTFYSGVPISKLSSSAVTTYLSNIPKLSTQTLLDIETKVFFRQQINTPEVIDAATDLKSTEFTTNANGLSIGWVCPPILKGNSQATSLTVTLYKGDPADNGIIVPINGQPNRLFNNPWGDQHLPDSPFWQIRNSYSAPGAWRELISVLEPNVEYYVVFDAFNRLGHATLVTQGPIYAFDVTYPSVTDLTLELEVNPNSQQTNIDWIVHGKFIPKSTTQMTNPTSISLDFEYSTMISPINGDILAPKTKPSVLVPYSAIDSDGVFTYSFNDSAGYGSILKVTATPVNASHSDYTSAPTSAVGKFEGKPVVTAVSYTSNNLSVSIDYNGNEPHTVYVVAFPDPQYTGSFSIAKALVTNGAQRFDVSMSIAGQTIIYTVDWEGIFTAGISTPAPGSAPGSAPVPSYVPLGEPAVIIVAVSRNSTYFTLYESQTLVDYIAYQPQVVLPLP